jgi:hypothetical protein
MTLSIPETIRVLLPGGAVTRLPLEEYVRGVVAAALPADAPIEALKAQAVAARTFGAITRRHIERGSDVCTLRHCQVWKQSATPSALRAAEETRGIVATHGGRLIDAYYFEHCDGSTRDATGILVQVPPYLRGVSCPCGFATLKGHGIGMCQRGALVKARFGDTFDVILKHYFNGISVERASGLATFVAPPEPPTTTTTSPRMPEEQSGKRPKAPIRGGDRTTFPVRDTNADKNAPPLHPEGLTPALTSSPDAEDEASKKAAKSRKVARVPRNRPPKKVRANQRLPPIGSNLAPRRPLYLAARRLYQPTLVKQRRQVRS